MLAGETDIDWSNNSTPRAYDFLPSSLPLTPDSPVRRYAKSSPRQNDTSFQLHIAVIFTANFFLNSSQGIFPVTEPSEIEKISL